MIALRCQSSSQSGFEGRWAVHASAQAQGEVQRRTVLDVIVAQRAAVFKLPAAKGEALLVRRDPFAVPYPLSEAFDRGRGIGFERERAARQEVDKDLHAAAAGINSRRSRGRMRCRSCPRQGTLGGVRSRSGLRSEGESRVGTVANAPRTKAPPTVHEEIMRATSPSAEDLTAAASSTTRPVPEAFWTSDSPCASDSVFDSPAYTDKEDKRVAMLATVELKDANKSTARRPYRTRSDKIWREGPPLPPPPRPP